MLSTFSSELLVSQQQTRLSALGVDLTKYPSVANRTEMSPIVINHKARSLGRSLLRSYLTLAGQATPDPMMLTHIVTTRCNYNCSFCSFADSLNAKHNELQIDEVKRIYKTLGKNLNVIIYSGGEPTLNNDLAEIVETAYEQTEAKSVFIISNAWKPELIFDITHRVMQRCPEIHLTWSLSIEGPRELNNSLRCTKSKNWDAWQNTIDTMEGLKAIRQHYGYDELDIQLCTTCSPNNSDLMVSWYETVRDVLQPDKWNLNLMRRSVQMKNSSLQKLSQRLEGAVEPFEQMYLKITQIVRDDVLSGKLKFMYHTRSVQDGALKAALDLLSQEENRRAVLGQPQQICCRAGTAGGYISSTGEVSACEEFAHNPDDKKSFGNLRLEDYDFQKVWRGERAAEYRKEVGKAAMCDGCTLESQRNYPSMLMSFQTYLQATGLSRRILLQNN